MGNKKMLLEDWLDDLCVRFIINLPEEDLSSVARICFQVEEAQWFYEDFIRPLDPSLPSMSLRSFCLRIFQHCPLLSAFSLDNHMRAFEEFLLYKTRVPVRGAIMLNHAMDSVLLVKGWKKGANWSFPRGKINKDEDDLDCAIREVYEETGYDIKAAGLAPGYEEVKYIEITMREQHMRLYVFRDVPMDTHFEPRTRKEISKIEWYRLSDLPAFRKKGQQGPDGAEAAINANKFYMVAPFLVPLKKWIAQQKKKDSENATSNQFMTSTFAEDTFTEDDNFVGRGVPKPNYETQLNLHPDAMERTTAELQRMLKIQPPTQGLQPEVVNTVESPSSRSNGEALLALIQGVKPSKGLQAHVPSSSPHTSLDLTFTEAPIPRTPHHDQLLPHSSQLPPPPVFNMQLDPRSFSSQQVQNFRAPLFHGNHLQQHQMPMQALNLAQQAYQPYSQTQSLQHPQPFPPHVQRTVFDGGQVHAPMVRPPVQGQSPAFGILQSESSNFKGRNILPSISAVAKEPSRKLNTHSLAMLNALRGWDTATSSNSMSNDATFPKTGQEVTASVVLPQELSAEQPKHRNQEEGPIRASAAPTMLDQQRTLENSARDEKHISSLLNMFKSPESKLHVPPNQSVSIQTSTNPTQSRGHSPEVGALAKNSSNLIRQSERPSQRKRPTSPFRPTSILARPTENPSTTQNLQLPPYTNRRFKDGSALVTAKPDQQNISHRGSTLERQVELSPPPTQPFQPTILRRPQQNSNYVVAEPGGLNQSAFQHSAVQISTNPVSSQSQSQVQKLLSLFGENSATAQPPIRTLGDRTPKSSVTSLASATDDSLSRRGSQNPISPADKGFLLEYLKGGVRGGHGL